MTPRFTRPFSRSFVFSVTFCLLLCGSLSAGPALTNAFSWIRGANYVPSYSGNMVGVWKNFDPAVIDRELGFAQSIHLNAVRMLSQYVVYEKNPKLFLERLETFVALSDKHGLKVMFVLFDSCFGEEPDFDNDRSSQWVNNPGYSRLAESNWKNLEGYVRAIVGKYKNDPRIFMWDVMNEPEADFKHVTAAERAHLLKFCRSAISWARAEIPSQPLTVGHAVVDYIPSTMDLVDVLSVHSYSPDAAWLENDLNTALTFGERSKKPVIVTECGNPAEHQPYDLALDVIEPKKMGFFVWEIMIGKVTPFNELAGLFYPDGSVRDLAAIARVAGFKTKSSLHYEARVTGESAPAPELPLKKMPNKDVVKKWLKDSSQWNDLMSKARKAPRTREGVIPFLEQVTLLVRQQLRPGDEAREAFEHALSIPHLFKLGHESEAVERYEKLLKLGEKAMAVGR